MNILIVGYGEMGRHVESVLTRRNHKITGIVDPVSGTVPEVTKELAEASDVAIEFAIPKAAVPNAELYSRLGLSVVMATTGWHDQLDYVKGLVEKGDIGFLYGSNFSIGAHLFFNLVKTAASIINPFDDYDILAYELHHNRKKDSPSGTARSIADIILKYNKVKEKLVVDKLDRPIEANELHFASVRGGDIPGVHKVLLDSKADTIEISHSARSRIGFATGAVMAAEWLGKKKGFFKIEDFIDEIMNSPVPQ